MIASARESTALERDFKQVVRLRKIVLVGAVCTLLGSSCGGSGAHPPAPPLALSVTPLTNVASPGPDASLVIDSSMINHPASPVPTAEPDSPGLYIAYAIQPGDTLQGIAEKFVKNPLYIRWNNPDACFDRSIGVGSVIVVPNVDGILHELRYGETVSDVAKLYGVSRAAVATANGLEGPRELYDGKLLIVPNAVLPRSVPTPDC